MASTPAALKFCIDTSSRKRVEGVNSRAEVQLPELVQADVIPLNVFLLKSLANTGRAPYYSVIPVSGLGLSVSIGDITGAYGVMSYQDTWTLVTASDDDGEVNYFAGNLSLDYTAMNTRFAAEQVSRFTTYFKVDVSIGGNWTTVYQKPVVIVKAARTHTGGEILPEDAITYLSKLEASNTYVKRYMGAGETIILTSQDGTKQVELGCSNDGGLTANEI